jgi:hypothetical protein
MNQASISINNHASKKKKEEEKKKKDGAGYMYV